MARQDPLLLAAREAFRLVGGTTSAEVALQRVAGLADGIPGVTPAVRAELERVPAPEPLKRKDAERAAKGAVDDLDPEPVAVTPLGQVHRGEHDGQEVAVKLRRGELAGALRTDFVLADAVIALLRPFVPREVDLAALALEVRERALEELDLEYEATQQRAAARTARRLKTACKVPAVLNQTDTALVTEWVQGTPLTAAPPSEDVALALLDFHVGLAARGGMVHADPDPHDTLVDGDTVWVLDWGATAPVPKERVPMAGYALQALREDDAATFGRALHALGWVREEGTGAALLPDLRDVLGPIASGPALLDPQGLEDAAERALVLVGAPAFPPAQDLWPLRMLGQLVLLLARGEHEADWTARALKAMASG